MSIGNEISISALKVGRKYEDDSQDNFVSIVYEFTATNFSKITALKQAPKIEYPAENFWSSFWKEFSQMKVDDTEIAMQVKLLSDFEVVKKESPTDESYGFVFVGDRVKNRTKLKICFDEKDADETELINSLQNGSQIKLFCGIGFLHENILCVLVETPEYIERLSEEDKSSLLTEMEEEDFLPLKSYVEPIERKKKRLIYM
ncbi:hypothetical protein M3Y98_00894200 [Aphelenchoides besseyi]|nr:hypothetical protein M3Y98_00894200 [Aphelenchoides besseyi]KAI6193025.1 hypothetical protein M3Y96_00974300 [Aphelenchoides besseyi]